MAGRITFCSTVSKLMEWKPMPTTAAPIRPPNRACEELDGRPLSQVIMFQRTAPMRPAKMMSGVMWIPSDPSRISPPEMVLATSVDRNAPTRLSTAARATAVLGLIAPVAMGVAIALAVSWNPLVKSKNRANAITSATMKVISTCCPICRVGVQQFHFPIPAIHSIVHRMFVGNVLCC